MKRVVVGCIEIPWIDPAPNVHVNAQSIKNIGYMSILTQIAIYGLNTGVGCFVLPGNINSTFWLKLFIK